jgi:hypothetical protein
MAEAPAGASGPDVPEALSMAATTPEPAHALQLRLIGLPAGQLLHRVHLAHYGAAQFNPGVQGNARFSPIQDDQGRPIPTLYAGTTRDGALMETVFHDVPHTAGTKTFDKRRLAGHRHSTVEVLRGLQLADLSSVALRRLGVTRKQLIDTEKDQYPRTREWARAIHRQCPQAQGLSWISRQDDSARAFVLFGDRVPDGALVQQGESRSLHEDVATYEAVLDLAERIGVYIVPGRL